ncbi:MAG: (d)CMP kinase [Desulfobulbaceae bacterium]|nr:(d)CMP kinase [Desulfobulbaceae bacterium]
MPELSVIAIDGPAGVGKSSVSRVVAAALGYSYLDTGAMYRAVAVFMGDAGISDTDSTAVAHALIDLHLVLAPSEDGSARVLINGLDITNRLRSPEISLASSRVSALPPVRQKLGAMQRQIGETGRVVAEGRDMGTVVFPDAAHKFFLDAKPEIRARRRALQLQAMGQRVDEAEILREIIQRDRQDSKRRIARLRPAATAVIIDTSDKTQAEVVRMIIDRVRAA